MSTWVDRPSIETAAVLADDQHHVVAVGGVDDDGVDRTVAAAVGAAEVDARPASRRCRDMSLTVMLSAPPSAWKFTVSTSFMSIMTLAMSRVNSARPPLAEMRDVLGDVGAVELQRVEAVLTLDGVVVVARVPDEGIVAGTHQRGVVAVTAIDQVVALAADQNVVAEAAVHRQLSPRQPRGCWR